MLLFVTVVLAGPWSTALTDLELSFRPKVDALLAALRADGHNPVLSTTWRDPAVQDLLAATGRATYAKGGQSCHNHLGPEYPPAEPHLPVGAGSGELRAGRVRCHE